MGRNLGRLGRTERLDGHFEVVGWGLQDQQDRLVLLLARDLDDQRRADQGVERRGDLEQSVCDEEVVVAESQRQAPGIEKREAVVAERRLAVKHERVARLVLVEQHQREDG
jgi:hypothetical protein